MPPLPPRPPRALWPLSCISRASCRAAAAVVRALAMVVVSKEDWVEVMVEEAKAAARAAEAEAARVRDEAEAERQ